ncbi:unnamed protein product, partial [Mesorhabditis belari]|uniref:Uncharacterized protein n=1 Tax=Mesorhabditis belari TaxID=2138241 RepID=A0AAF3FRV2_9BILA
MHESDTENGNEAGPGTIKTVSSKDELPNSIIITQVPDEVFNNPVEKRNFCEMFNDIDENIHFDFLKSFRRIRIIFSTPENATTGKCRVEHFSFKGIQLKAYFGQRVLLRSSSGALLQPPPLEKQFLISPPCSPPVGWEQMREMAPVVCSFDLMARLAAFAVDEEYKVHDSGDTGAPSIIVSPCETPLDAPSKIEMPRTPRPGTPNDGEEPIEPLETN